MQESWSEQYRKAISINELYKAAVECSQGVIWKDSVSKWMHNVLKNVSILNTKLENGTYKLSQPKIFCISDPKPRIVHAMRYADRVVQRSLCNNGLYEILTKSFIYDNCACQYRKGTMFALERMKVHLHKWYSEHHSNEGAYAAIDIKKYFNSTPHCKLKEIVDKKVQDQQFKEKIFEVIDIFKDQRKMSEIQKDPFGKRGIGIGSQISQLLQLLYLDSVDHYAKEQLHIKHYIRYMDDMIFLASNIEEAKMFMASIQAKLAELGLAVNDKSRIGNIKDGLVFLKTHLQLTATGKVKHKCIRKTIVKEQRRTRCLYRKHAEDKIKLKDVIQHYNSWLGCVKHKLSRRQLSNMKHYIQQIWEVNNIVKQKKENDMSNIISKNVLAEKIAADRFNGEVTPMTTDPTELLFAFNTYFKPTCDAIGKMIGVENFKGGFDEIQKLYRYVLEIDASTDEGKQQLLNAHTLAIQWEAADAYCKHEATKLRWKPAEWWKFCWMQFET